LFFLSSRRRHTRFSRDWSSDVCSSDLGSLTPEVEDMIRRSLLEDEEGATEPLYAQTGMVRDHQGNLVEPEQKTSQNRSEGRARDMEELSEEELAEKKAAALRMLTGWGC